MYLLEIGDAHFDHGADTVSPEGEVQEAALGCTHTHTHREREREDSALPVPSTVELRVLSLMQ